ncbi:hypothetical protein CYMTET_21519 [Cymbomonas tetramitiformis]|uniref:Uncharacterized protein n=1 Tax=Cymbomonas tetramitiformis TaxID=36881 RepID=A0AAE0G371_9CHLO|nr:hypothetical protein CYMTET_21519 [Cymbomonas tetramitiformis]
MAITTSCLPPLSPSSIRRKVVECSVPKRHTGTRTQDGDLPKTAGRATPDVHQRPVTRRIGRREWATVAVPLLEAGIVLQARAAGSDTQTDLSVAEDVSGVGSDEKRTLQGKPCPNLSGVRASICYGPCCNLDWGPGGPICLLLAFAVARAARPDAKEAKLPNAKPDQGTLLFALALFLSSVPRTTPWVLGSSLALLGGLLLP